MAESTEELEAMFPRLDDAQIARVMPFGRTRNASAGEVLYEQGDATHGVFVVLEGSIEIVSISTAGESALRILERGAFTGEVNQLSGSAQSGQVPGARGEFRPRNRESRSAAHDAV